MTISVRDHSHPVHPLLQHLAPDTYGPIHWTPTGQVRWHDHKGAAHQITPGAAMIERWLRCHTPNEFWALWAQHLAGHRYLVEHTSINPVHPLHAGSLRSTLLGNSLTRLLRSAGADVQVRYFVNDRGRQVHLLRKIAAATDWRHVPARLRLDEAAGVLYALVNMTEADRHADIARLTRTHPWLRMAVNHTAHRRATTQPDLIHELVDLASQDMDTAGASVDVYDYESALPADLFPTVLDLAHRHPTVTINGTLCLRRPEGLVPLSRPDHSALYFVRDVANTHRRLPTGRTILHVIGSDQTLLQAALRDTVSGAAIEHIAFAEVTRAGKKFSARQNRLLTLPDLRRRGGQHAVWGLAAAMLLRRRSRRIDLAHLDQTRPLRTILAAHTYLNNPAHHASEPLRRGSPTWWGLVTGVLQAPGVLHRATTTRDLHTAAHLLLDLSRRYVTAACKHQIPGRLTEWVSDTHHRLTHLHGLDLDTLTATAEEQSHRMTSLELSRRAV